MKLKITLEGIIYYLIEKLKKRLLALLIIIIVEFCAPYISYRHYQLLV